MNRIIGGFAFLVLYCLSIGVATSSFAAAPSQEETSIKKSISVVFAAQSVQITTTDNAINGGLQFDGKVKTNFIVGCSSDFSIEQTVEYFNQYNQNWKNLLIDSRKQNRIFPYHSFW